MDTFVTILFSLLGLVVTVLTITRPKQWDFWPGFIVAFAFALGTSAASHYSDDKAVPIEGGVAIMIGLAIAITLACRFMRLKR